MTTLTATTRSVLVVDDSPVDRMLVSRIIERSGRFGQVLSASNGAQALEMYHEYATHHAADPDRFPPIIVLVDINMPVMDGFTLIDEVAELAGSIDQPHWVLILSSSEDPGDMSRAQEHPVIEDYLVKPVTMQIAHDLADRFL